ncbi:hypothetical protein LXL04_037463 [Taraxacum kok-saghyz]
MSQEDYAKVPVNVFKMEQLGAQSMECHRNGCKSRMFLGLGKECGNNSLCHGSVHEFIQDKEVRLIGVEHAAYLVDKDKYVTPLQNGVIGEYLGGTA